MRLMTICLAALACLACQASDAKPPAPDGKEAKTGEELRIVPDVEKRVTQFAPVPFSADLSALTPEDRQVLDKLVAAAKLMNEIFLRQAWAGNTALRDQLASYQGEHAEATRLYFDVNFGPWDRLAERQPFIGDQPHPSGAGHYPEDMTKEEFEGWIAKHPGDKEALTSTFTEVRRGQDGALVAVPYSREYAEWLKPAAQLLREAAALTSNASLKKFLDLRAAAFESDDYYASDVAWMDLDAPVEVTIGPYETYEDELFGYKAAFEAFVTVNLPKESAALARYKEQLPWLERNLPIPDEHKNLNRGTESPIRVVDTVYSAGETRAGVQTIAFNLPNDERVREAKGSKKVLLHNTMRAKYDRILLPIAERVLDPAQVKDVSFEAYFDEVLHHELSHGLGPGTITVNGRKTEVRLELKELFASLEEAKADVMGVYNILALIEKGEMTASLRKSLEPTYVAGLFRSARFGVDESHGQGVVAQFNYLLAKGALRIDASGKVHAVSEKFPAGIRDLLRDMLMLQANGDYEGTKRFLDTYGKATQPIRDAIGRLGDVPVDIRPVYQAEK
ncbi:MAG TPA: peptidase [Thermoanaerobaculia bacterium]|nr:peptidase [Thermoanaerobaculia bacterium]